MERYSLILKNNIEVSSGQILTISFKQGKIIRFFKESIYIFASQQCEQMLRI